MEKQIRKISVGENIADALNYQIGSTLGSSSTINYIQETKDEDTGEKIYRIYIKSNEENEIQLWKRFSGRVVFHVEYVLE